MKKVLTEKDQLIEGFKKRIKFRKNKLAETVKFNRAAEQAIYKTIKLDQLQLRALQK